MSDPNIAPPPDTVKSSNGFLGFSLPTFGFTNPFGSKPKTQTLIDAEAKVKSVEEDCKTKIADANKAVEIEKNRPPTTVPATGGKRNNKNRNKSSKKNKNKNKNKNGGKKRRTARK